MGDVLKFPARLQAYELSAEHLRAIEGMAQDLGGLIDAGLLQPTVAPPPKALVADGERWVWTPAPVAVAIHQLPGFRPFHGVAWQLTPNERRLAETRRRLASRDWLKEIFRRGR